MNGKYRKLSPVPNNFEAGTQDSLKNVYTSPFFKVQPARTAIPRDLSALPEAESKVVHRG